MIQEILSFLRDIGLPVREGGVTEGSFLPGVRIEDGGLVVDRDRLAWPGDLLHEAGHLAVTPAARRPLLAVNVESEGGEVEATAWAYAASRHLGLSASVLFHEGGYQGKSASLIFTYESGVYPGAHGLAQAGMTAVGPGVDPVAAYPHMTRWLRA